METGKNIAIQILDCTLRDGGYINNWKWGYQEAKDILSLLVKAGVDVAEVGFLKDVEEYDPDITVCNRIEELNRLLPENHDRTIFSAMAMCGNYNVSKLSPYSGSGIEMIRVTAHDYDIAEGMNFAMEVKRRGYKLSINPINIMGYSDDRILWMLGEVNKIQPYQFSIVDTFGSMKRRDLDRIVSLVDHNLDRGIRVGIHLHENMSLSCLLAQQFIDKHLKRAVAVDGSLMGMGRSPGNLPIELIADYLNEYMDKAYDIDYMMDAIQDYVLSLRGKTEWGYEPSYFLSAKYNLHRNYAEYYLKKGDLTNRDINHILAKFDKDKLSVFDAKYADEMYLDYKGNKIDDELDMEKLQGALWNRIILILAPGESISSFKHKIIEFIGRNNPIIISVNFVPEFYEVDYAFFSNNKRYSKYENSKCKIIATSNLPDMKADYRINYNRLSSAFEQGFNSYVMLLKLLKQLHIEKVYVSGADGYFVDKTNYYKTTFQNASLNSTDYNEMVINAVKRIGIEVTYLTPSAYK